MGAGRPLLFETPEALQKQIEKYFKSCWGYKRDKQGQLILDDTPDTTSKYVMEQVKPYTVSGLAVYLNTSRETLMNYQKRDEYFDTIKKAKDMIYAYTEEFLFTNKPTGAIFSLKHNYGWKDKQEITIDSITIPTIINDAPKEQDE
jgi:hypothetical protein